MKTLRNIIPFLLVAVLVAAGSVYGAITSEAPVVKETYRTYELFASTTAPATVATTTSATSTNITPFFDAEGRYFDGSVDLRGAKKATFYVSRGGATGANTGSSAFSVEVSGDGTTWHDFNKLVQNTATSTNEWMVGSVSIAAATSTTIVSLDLEDHTFLKARCIVIETTDGEHRCQAAIEY